MNCDKISTSASGNIILSPADVPPGMLAYPQIRKCLDLGLLVEGYIDECLRRATYDMRLGESAWRFVNGKRLNFHLGPAIDTTREIVRTLVLAPNSLTFVTTIENFNLPADIIARFNLKSKWVHKGLLLGTAPIVDPDFKGKMLLPLHNFSSNIVQIDYGDPLLTVEFTKTLPVDGSFVSEGAPKGDIGFYLNSAGIVESAVFKAINRSEALLESIQSKTKFFSIAGAMSLFLLISANLSLLVNIFNTAENARKQSITTQGMISSFSDKNRAITESFRNELDAVKVEIETIKHMEGAKNKYLELQKRLDKLEHGLNGGNN